LPAPYKSDTCVAFAGALRLGIQRAAASSCETASIEAVSNGAAPRCGAEHGALDSAVGVRTMTSRSISATLDIWRNRPTTDSYVARLLAQITPHRDRPMVVRRPGAPERCYPRPRSEGRARRGRRPTPRSGHRRAPWDRRRQRYPGRRDHNRPHRHWLLNQFKAKSQPLYFAKTLRPRCHGLDRSAPARGVGGTTHLPFGTPIPHPPLCSILLRRASPWRGNYPVEG